MKFLTGNEGLLVPYEPPTPKPPQKYYLPDDWLIEFQRDGKTIYVARTLLSFAEEFDHVPPWRGLSLWKALEYVREHQLLEFKLCQIPRETH